MSTEDPRQVAFPPKDAPLREDVSALGALVGEVLREQGGDELFENVESARTSAIRRREGGDGDELELLVQRLPASQAAELVRAFSLYFQVVNLAEKVHRIRRRRVYLRAGADPQRDSIEDAIGQFRLQGVAFEDLMNLLGRLRIEPVFTAHPTEATRRTILEKQQRIARRLVERLDPSLTPAELRANWARIRMEITSAWQTEEHPSQRPTVRDEREQVLFYLTDILYRIVPPFHEALQHALLNAYGSPESLEVPTLLRFASWVGGDMDGNPNVTARTIEESLEEHRRLLLPLYRRDVLQLSRQLSQSVRRVEVSRELQNRLAAYMEFFPKEAAAIPSRHRGMPYRCLLRLSELRLQRTLDEQPHAYGSAQEFADDLRLVAESLGAHKGVYAGLFAVRRLLRRVESLGFHLATLDVRQDSQVHRRVVAQLLGVPDWEDLSSDERSRCLEDLLQNPGPPPVSPSGAAEETLQVFSSIASCRRRFGEDSAGPYITSMSQEAGDLLTVLLLARWAGLGSADGSIPLDVVPLFETVPDLQAAPQILKSLLESPFYRRHLDARGARQMIMIGYSDSNKEGGITSSRWALQQAQQAISEILGEAGVDWTFFHGRGGTISRGGGRTYRSVMAAPEGSVRGRLRVTEQGETINANYGLRGIAMRTLERSFSAVARASLSQAPDQRLPDWRAKMAAIASDSRDAYRGLVYGNPDFVRYFRLATPIDVIERMTIGSRPPSRRSGAGIEDLRAIPWVFSWTQSRHLLPGWLGLGCALDKAVGRHGPEPVAEMIRDWPFLENLLDDVELVLATADMPIAERYAQLAGRLGEEFFPLIRDAYDHTVETILELRGHSRLLEREPVLQRTIRLRNPYVDPMSLLQVELLSRWRASRRRDEEVLRALLATVNGIAQGLQGTG